MFKQCNWKEYYPGAWEAIPDKMPKESHGKPVSITCFLWMLTMLEVVWRVVLTVAFWSLWTGLQSYGFQSSKWHLSPLYLVPTLLIATGIWSDWGTLLQASYNGCPYWVSDKNLLWQWVIPSQHWRSSTIQWITSISRGNCCRAYLTCNGTDNLVVDVLTKVMVGKQSCYLILRI